MPDRPLILFPSPERANREHKNPVFTKTSNPSYDRQFTRLQPSFNVLNSAFTQKSLKVQRSPVGMNPEFALVFEIIGTVDNFYKAVKKTDGLEWIFDKETEGIEPDDDFYLIDTKTGDRIDDTLNGKLYCVMSNQQALTQLLSLWHRHQNGETDVFKRGFTGIRDLFTHIKDIRKWDAQDRITETHAVEYWRESLEIDGDSLVSFEIELFYRSDVFKRNTASETIRREIHTLNGRIIQECIISEVCYHGMLVELPRIAIEDLVNRYEEIELSQVDDIMFFRPTCQSVFTSETDSEAYTEIVDETTLPTGDAVIAVFDGMPMQNHRLLHGRIIVDDPDDYATGYESKYRVHGTSMVSFAIHGDINRHDTPISTPVYVRPILRPKQSGLNTITECVPNNTLFIDVLHRAVKRMMKGDENEPATAPNTRIINISIGDPVRQLAVTMSPIARLLDFLAYKYNVLFIISAGNHPEIINYLDNSFDELKALDLSTRNSVFGKAIKENQRNLKVLAPAESMNGLTIGALYDDFSTVTENERLILAVEKGMPSPISSVGKGYRSIITPDIFYYGGIKLLQRTLDGKIKWAESTRMPGCLSAAPYGNGADGLAFSFGTSDAAAQITHEAAKCHDVLNQVFVSETGDSIPIESTAILLKAMLVHGASWEPIANKLTLSMKCPTKQLSRWLGNGIPNISQVIECTKERVTLIGLGALKRDEGNIFRLPLPVDFSSRLIKRKLTVTLAYISPIAPNKQAYRCAQLWFSVNDSGKRLVPDRQNTEWQAVRKGTLQHEIFVGENPIVWNDDDLEIKVSCKEEADKFKTAIPYCLFVSFEIAEGFDVDLYNNVSTKIHQRIRITNNY